MNYCPKQFFVFHNRKAFQGGKHGCKRKKNLQVRKTFIFVHALQTQCSQEICQLLKRHELPVCHMCVLTRAVKYPSAFHLRAKKIQRFQDGFEAMFLAQKVRSEISSLYKNTWLGTRAHSAQDFDLQVRDHTVQLPLCHFASDSLKPFCVSLVLWSGVKEGPLEVVQFKKRCSLFSYLQLSPRSTRSLGHRRGGTPVAPRNKDFFLLFWAGANVL